MKSAISKRKKLLASDLTIYDELRLDHPLYFSDKELEYLLKSGLLGLSTKGLPPRTRSKLVKEKVCLSIGYPVPASFKKTRPRFLGQNFDTYIQKSPNLQIWNEEVLSDRRYILVLVNGKDVIFSIVVLTGDGLKALDTTGTLTKKYQARLGQLASIPDIYSRTDTPLVVALTVKEGEKASFHGKPSDRPQKGQILPMGIISQKLRPLIGMEFANLGRDQDRNRGAIVHREVCRLLGYRTFSDDGQFPDIRGQLLEVKLQTSPTIDLGSVLPSSTDIFMKLNGFKIRYCDIRYLVCSAKIWHGKLKVVNFALGTGEDFFKKFDQFQGIVVNKKVQIPLPKKFFNS